MKGYILDKPDLNFREKKCQPMDNGIFKNRTELFKPVNLEDYLFVYSLGKNARRDESEADDAASLIIKAGRTYGIHS